VCLQAFIVTLFSMASWSTWEKGETVCIFFNVGYHEICGIGADSLRILSAWIDSSLPTKFCSCWTASSTWKCWLLDTFYSSFALCLSCIYTLAQWELRVWTGRDSHVRFVYLNAEARWRGEG
jgi:hypothetical protein